MDPRVFATVAALLLRPRMTKAWGVSVNRGRCKERLPPIASFRDLPGTYLPSLSLGLTAGQLLASCIDEDASYMWGGVETPQAEVKSLKAFKSFIVAKPPKLSPEYRHS